MSTRDEVRKALLATTGSHFKKKKVNALGKEIEVRSVPVGKWESIVKESNESDVALQINLIINCAYVNGEKLFTQEDFDTLISMPVGSYLDIISGAAIELMGKGVSDAKKN